MKRTVTCLRAHLLRWCLALWCLAAAQPVLAQSDPGGSAAAQQRHDGQRDFDFEFGAWEVQLSRLVDPLTGSDTWVEYEGTSVVREVWNGRANLGELDVEGPAGRIVGLSMRLYNPESRQWYISWASSADGALGPPMIGTFEDGIGEFYNQEIFNGQAIFVRFIFSDITDATFRLEQAFSNDGGRSWEANWIARFSRSGGSEAPAPEARAPEAPSDRAAPRTIGSTIDARWNARDADGFSELFTEEASFQFPDRGTSLDGRATIRRYFAEQFPQFAPELRHRTSVRETRMITPDFHTVDGTVEIVRVADDEGTEPTLLRSFAIFALMHRSTEGWKIRELRAYQLPATAGEAGVGR